MRVWPTAIAGSNQEDQKSVVVSPQVVNTVFYLCPNNKTVSDLFQCFFHAARMVYYKGGGGYHLYIHATALSRSVMRRVNNGNRLKEFTIDSQ